MPRPRWRRRRWVAGLAVVSVWQAADVASAQAAAPDRTRWGNLVFTLPAGTEPDGDRMGRDELPVIHLDDGDDATPDLRLLGGAGGADAASEAAAAAWVERRAAGLTEGDWTAETATPMQWHTRADGVTAGLARFRVLDGRGRVRAFFNVVAVLDAAAARVDAVALPVAAEDVSERPGVVQEALGRMAAFLDGCELATRGATTLPPARRGPLDGYHWGSSMRTSAVYGGGINTHFTYRRFTFFLNGRFMMRLAGRFGACVRPGGRGQQPRSADTGHAPTHA